MIIPLTGILNDGTPHRPGVPIDASKTLSIPHGSDLLLEVRVVNPGGAPVDLSRSGTSLILTIKKQPSNQPPRIVKEGLIQGGYARFHLGPGDTKNLQPGQYVYDIWLNKDGYRNAIIPLSAFQLLPSAAAIPSAPPPPTISLVEGDTEPFILDFSGADISGWAIELHIAYPTPLVKTATIIDGPGGIASVLWGPTDLIPGIWGGEIQSTRPGPFIQTSDVYVFDIRAEIA